MKSNIPEHTPAPWQVSDERECQTEHFATVMSHHDSTRGAVIAELRGNAPYRDGEGMANAKLIAAAPELLAELCAAVDFFSRGVASLDKTECEDDALMAQINERLDAMRSAIAKATA